MAAALGASGARRLGACLAPVAAAVAFATMPAGGSLATGAAAAAAGRATPNYSAYVSLFGDPVRGASQGAGWTLSFRERVSGRVPYKACLAHLDPPRVSRCWRRRSRPANRRQDVFVALYVNDVGGPGRWRARWFVRGRRVGQWRFRVRPEFEGQ